jgi:hypothetical protein
MLLFGVAGRGMVSLPGRGTPRREGDGTAPRALSGPCGITLEGVRGPRAGELVLPARAGEPKLRLKLAGGCMRETTGRIPLREGGAAAG